VAKVTMDSTRLRAALAEAAEVAMEKAALGMVGYVRTKVGISARVVMAGGQGRGNRRRAAAKRYQPSAPGEPPRKRTGTLQKSIAHEVERQPGAVLARVGTKVDYGRFLEFGTRRMKARPYLRPALTEYLPKFHSIVMTELRRKFPRR
jgi:HK97 gp10 family phage protein